MTREKHAHVNAEQRFLKKLLTSEMLYRIQWQNKWSIYCTVFKTYIFKAIAKYQLDFSQDQYYIPTGMEKMCVYPGG